MCSQDAAEVQLERTRLQNFRIRRTSSFLTAKSYNGVSSDHQPPLSHIPSQRVVYCLVSVLSLPFAQSYQSPIFPSLSNQVCRLLMSFMTPSMYFFHYLLSLWWNCLTFRWEGLVHQWEEIQIGGHKIWVVVQFCPWLARALKETTFSQPPIPDVQSGPRNTTLV